MSLFFCTLLMLAWFNDESRLSMILWPSSAGERRLCPPRLPCHWSPQSSHADTPLAVRTLNSRMACAPLITLLQNKISHFINMLSN